MRVLIADPLPIVLYGLDALLSATPGIAVVARCSDGGPVVRTIKNARPHVAVIATDLPGLGGLEIAKQVAQLEWPVRVVLTAPAMSRQEALDAVRYGVRGVVLKTMKPELFVRCIRKVYDGGTWAENASMREGMHLLLQRQAAEVRLGRTLSARELEIVRLAVTGLSNAAIAEALGITEGTVKTHLHRVYGKLQLAGRIPLLVYAREHGLT